MMHVERSLALRIIDLVEVARETSSEFGVDRLCETAVEQLSDALGIAVVEVPEDEQPEPCLQWPVGSKAVLFLRANLTFTAKRFARLVAIAHRLRASTPEAAVGFALVGLLNIRQVRSHGAAWVRSRLRSLAELGEDHFGAWWSANASSVTTSSMAAILELANAQPSLTGSARGDVAYLVGHVARARADYQRAIAWFEAGQAAADPQYQALCAIGLGKTHRQRGRYPEAKRWYELASEQARAAGLRSIEGSALHTLMVFAAEQGDVAEVRSLASAALQAYGPGHPDLPALASDLARFWIERGFSSRALPVLLVLGRLDFSQYPTARTVVAGSVAKAAAAVGDVSVFESAYADVVGTAARMRCPEDVAEALVEVAEAAAALGDWRRTRNAARMAQEIAAARGESRWTLAAEELASMAEECRRYTLAKLAESYPESESDQRLGEALVAAIEGGGGGAFSFSA